MSPIIRVTPIFLGIRLKCLKRVLLEESANKALITRMFKHYEEDMSKLTFGDKTYMQEEMEMSHMLYMLECIEPAITCINNMQKIIQDMYWMDLKMMHRITQSLDVPGVDIGTLGQLPSLALHQICNALCADL